jgi:mRNA-degrading endonuclease RelE of RelBE toxin-antitoxin system
VYKIETTPTFEKDLKSLSKEVAVRIINKIEWLAEHPGLLRFPLKYLPKGLQKLQKYRVGDWRVLFWVNHNNKIITLYGVEHRRQIYRW